MHFSVLNYFLHDIFREKCLEYIKYCSIFLQKNLYSAVSCKRVLGWLLHSEHLTPDAVSTGLNFRVITLIHLKIASSSTDELSPSLHNSVDSTRISKKMNAFLHEAITCQIFFLQNTKTGSTAMAASKKKTAVGAEIVLFPLHEQSN